MPRVLTIKFLLFVFSFSSLVSCSPPQSTEQKTNENSNALFVQVESEYSGIKFKNEIEDQKDFNVFKYRNFYNGGGVAIGDINNDGLPDIFFTANMKPNKLYLNKGNFKFEDITDLAGVAGIKQWDTGVVMFDVNGDGYLDIYVSNAGNMEGNNHDNDLYINNGNLTFSEKAQEYNLARSGFSTHASFFDYDKDGDLDAYILNNSNVPVSSLGYAADREKRASDWENVPAAFRGVGDLFLRNDNGKFVDVSEEAGIYGSLIGFGLGVMACDINEDNYTDLYITNDFYERDYLYINQKNGKFSEEIKNWTSHLCLSAMGVDIADVNNDGLGDIFITDMMPESIERTKKVMEFENYDVLKLKQERDFYQQYIQNTLQINNGNNSFSETAYFSGVARTDWSWAGLIFDMDNDGYKDIYVTNGIIHDLTDIDFVDFLANDIIRNTVLTGEKKEVSSIINKMPVTALPNYAYKNVNNLRFKNFSSEWGLNIPSFSNGCAYGDLDNDGDLDLVVNNVNMEAFVFKNQSRELTNNHYLQFSLKGKDKNLFAIGTKVKLFNGKQVMVQELMPSRGFQSSMDYTLTFGLGDILIIDSISVIWPDNKVTTLKNVKADQKITLSQSEGKSFDWLKHSIKNSKQQPLFIPVPNTKLSSHHEDLFDDFDQEFLLTKHISREGPALCVGDVNSDGNEDIYVGGAKNQPGTLYLHTGNGKLIQANNKAFLADKQYEDTAGAFIDCNGDGNLDLVIGSGGNIINDKDNYKVRIYLNDGKGNFSRSNDEPPALKSNISVIAPCDFDGDHDVDLFIGSRNVTGVYGVNPSHQFLVNDGNGRFSESLERVAYDIKSAGMICDAKWVDFDGDEKMDLVTVSDWGSPIIYKNNGRRLTKIKSSLDSLLGWWKVIETGDFDNDGDQDFVIGNAGLNIPFPATEFNPVKLWVNDFDENGSIEQIMTVHENNSDYPIHMRREITAQIPGLKKQNLKASDYSKRTIQKLFKNEVVNNSIVKSVTKSESVIAVNEGNGNFKIFNLPDRVQWSCVCGITCMDLNKDGNLDLVMGGNNFEQKPQFSRQDASYGNVLLGDGKMGFEWQSYNSSGFFERAEVRHLAKFIDKNGKPFIFVAINNDVPKVYSPGNNKK